MGYAHGKQYTPEEIKEAVFEVVAQLGLDRMPSKSEIEEYYGDMSLTNKISRSGGFYHLANIYGLEVKKSESYFGIKHEQLIREMLIARGFDAELTPTRAPYDILVDGRVKIDVKAGRIVKTNGCGYYTFNLEKIMQTCDVYVVVTLNSDDTINKIYVIPASIMTGKTQLSIGIAKSKYERFVDRWDYIETLDEVFGDIEAS